MFLKQINFLNQSRILFFIAVFLYVGSRLLYSVNVEEDIADGRVLFKGYGCNTCHTIDHKGGSIGFDLTYVGFRKSEKWLDTFLKDPVAWKKKSLMPNFYLKDPVRTKIIQYLLTLKGGSYKENSPWDAPLLLRDSVKRGEVIYEKVGCVSCHGFNGNGKYPNNNVKGGEIPSLKNVRSGYSKKELLKKIKYGSTPIPADGTKETPMLTMPAWKEVLSDDEILSVIDYLFSLQPEEEDEDDW